MSGERKQKKPRKRSLTADRSRGGAWRSRGDDRACIKSHRRAEQVSAGGIGRKPFPFRFQYTTAHCRRQDDDSIGRFATSASCGHAGCAVPSDPRAQEVTGPRSGGENGMPESKRKTTTSSAVKNRYNKRVYGSVTALVPKPLAEAFKAKCAETGTPQAQVVKRAIEQFLRDHGVDPASL